MLKSVIWDQKTNSTEVLWLSEDSLSVRIDNIFSLYEIVTSLHRINRYEQGVKPPCLLRLRWRQALSESTELSFEIVLRIES